MRNWGGGILYQQNGNLKTKSGCGYTYDPSHKHAVSFDNGTSYGYDANGNLTTRGDQAIRSDTLNRPLLVQANGATVVRFAYDGDGVRRKRVDQNGTTHYLGQFYEYNLTIQTATTYCPFNGTPIAMKQGLVVTYPRQDQLGSLVSATQSDPEPRP